MNDAACCSRNWLRFVQDVCEDGIASSGADPVLDVLSEPYTWAANAFFGVDDDAGVIMSRRNIGL